MHTTADGDTVFVTRLRDGQTVEEYRAGRSKNFENDARVMAVTYNNPGTRHRLWRDVVNNLQLVPFEDWPLPGPRTAVWRAMFLDRRGGGPMDHHRWWISNLRLEPHGLWSTRARAWHAGFSVLR